MRHGEDGKDEETLLGGGMETEEVQTSAEGRMKRFSALYTFFTSNSGSQ